MAKKPTKTIPTLKVTKSTNPGKYTKPARKKTTKSTAKKSAPILKIDKNDLAWVLAGHRRRAILRELEGGYETPSTLCEKTGCSMVVVSKVLRDMYARRIVLVANPDDIKGRLYGLTMKGENLLKNME